VVGADRLAALFRGQRVEARVILQALPVSVSDAARYNPQRLVRSPVGQGGAMIPSSLFFDLVDAGVAFKVCLGETRYSIPRARNGRLRLVCDGGGLEGSAEEILWRLNALIAGAEDAPGATLENASEPWLDMGSVWTGAIETEPARGKAASFPATIPLEITILAADGPLVKIRTAVFEVILDRRSILLHGALIAADRLVELGRLSRRALPRDIHAQIAAAGIRWTGKPDATLSFIDMYGEEALEAAEAEMDAEQRAFSDALAAARRPKR